MRDEYFRAEDKYKILGESDKSIIELYAGQTVNNCLLEFETIIRNVFISGHNAGEESDPINNKICVARRKLINSMRSDIVIY